MDLANINLQPIFNTIDAVKKQVHLESLLLDTEKFRKLISLAKQVFGDAFKIRVGEHWLEEVERAVIYKAKDRYDAIVLSFNLEGTEAKITYTYDDESNCWLAIMRSCKQANSIVNDLILTEKLAPLIQFEINHASFKVVELANKIKNA